MDGGPYQSMLSSLRQTFSEKIPGGLTPPAEQRLQRTLSHYIKEITRVRGVIEEQEIMKETFDSMVGWFRRHVEYLKAAEAPVAAAPVLTAPPIASSVLPNQEEDPLSLFERLRSRRAAPQDPEPAPVRLPAALEPLETRAKPQPKDLLQRQEDVVKYREVEMNLIINSKDRDWSTVNEENRYNFSVLLDGGARPQGTGPQATLTSRLRNIVRIEFVKALLPVEGLEMVYPRGADASSNYSEEAFYSALAVPYVHIMMDEYQGNSIGTNPSIEKSFAVCQYDATWRTDTVTVETTTNRGYTLFFPKFMKAQRVYAPAPLGSLLRLNFQILSPENHFLSKQPDAFSIAHVWHSAYLPAGSVTNYDDAGGPSQYLFLETKEWFPLWAFLQLDKVTLRGLTFTSTTSAYETAGAALNQWLEREEGHIVVAIVHRQEDGALKDGANTCGYANFIVIRHRFEDPRTNGGVCERYSFGSDEEAVAIEMSDYPYQQGAVLNLSRQVQLTLRVITRELDGASNMRPDNV